MTHQAQATAIRDDERAQGRRPRILFIAAYRSRSDQPDSGGQQRLALLQQAAAAVGDLTTLYAQPWGNQGRWGYYAHTQRSDFACIAAAHHGNLAQRKLPSDFKDNLAGVNPRDFDVIFLHRLSTAWWTALVDPRRVIVDIDDLPSLVYEQRARHGNALMRLLKHLRYRRLRTSERRTLDHFRFGLVCSEDDRQYLNHPHAHVLPNVYWPHPAMQQPPLSDPPGSLLFVGSLIYEPNVRGLEWFVQQVLPRIRARRPDASLTVVGKCHKVIPDAWTWRHAAGVRFVGTVADVGSYIREAKAQICPVLSGGGTRIKILESLAFGCPIVCTRFGASGHRLDETHGVYRHDDPQQFAEACLRLLSDPAARQPAREVGRPYVQAHFSPQAFYDNVRDMIETILRETQTSQTQELKPQ